MASDRELLLATFRRELANYLVRLDPDRFLHLYRNAFQIEAALAKAPKEVREAEFTIITTKYPMYTDFDFLGTREHVLYADALSTHAVEEIEQHYLNLVKFHALQRSLDPDWEFRSAATTEQNIAHLEKYVQQIKDTRFRQRLDAAVAEFFAHRRGNRVNDPEGATTYETVLAAYYLPSFADNRTGFHFKDTDEFGIFSSFHDDSRDKTYKSFYRSDRNFEAEESLDYLRIDERI